MPKQKKIRAPALSSQRARQEPLGQVIDGDETRGKYATPVRARRRAKELNGGKGEDEFLDPKTSHKILTLSREQQLQVELEEQQERARQQRQRQQSQQQQQKGMIDSDDEDEEEEDDEVEDVFFDKGEDYIENDDDGYINVREGTIGLSAEDEAAVASMMGRGYDPNERRTLADIIMEKIAEKEAAQRGESMMNAEGQEAEEDDADALPPKVVEVYTDIGRILSQYRSGKLPKAFKVIPSLSNWEQVLYLTRPDQWTPQAMFAATRIFASNLNPKMAQRFYNLVLLDAVRADVYAQKKLNYHYYMSLKKAVYKPAAFFKGILLPLCRQDDVTLREAAIIASVLQRVSIPVHHAAVAIHKLAVQGSISTTTTLKDSSSYNGATSIFIKTLLNKKYSLPTPVIESLIRHFTSFMHDDRTLPVLWHQALLVFVQRYKLQVQEDAAAREALRVVMKKHFHPKITPEIRRELFGTQAYQEERSVKTSVAGSVTTATKMAL